MIPKIVLLVGHISSGKSTYCQNVAGKGFTIVNDDAIVKLVHGDNYTLYDEKLKILYKGIENQVVTLALALNKIILVDRGVNVSVKGRKRWIALAHSFDVPCEAIVFPSESPEIHAKRRTESDSRGWDYDVWLKVAQKHHDIYELPTHEEGFDKIYNITWNEIQKGVLPHDCNNHGRTSSGR